MIDRVKLGKRNIIRGREFEKKVRKDLESKGWIISKWQNNVEFYVPELNETKIKVEKKVVGNSIKYERSDTVQNSLSFGRLIPAKQGRFRKTSTGFPDFIAFKEPYNQTPMGVNFFGLPSSGIDIDPQFLKPYIVVGVEGKSGGYLSREEKDKCKWLIENNIFGKVLIAKKGKKRGEIIYETFN